MEKYIKLLAEYDLSITDAKVKKACTELLEAKCKENRNKEVYIQLLSFLDLTSLNVTDDDEKIKKLTDKVNQFDHDLAELPNVAAICVNPNHIATVRSNLEVTGVRIAAVSGGFPSGQTFTEVKTIETSLSILDGAEEIDIVLNLSNYLASNFDLVCEEIEEIKDAAKGATLKVILETGILLSATNIKKAAILAITSGADFLKTSTGKVEIGATPEAAYIICKTIREFYDKHHTKIGFKAAGGVKTVEDAVIYYTIVKELLGEEWLTPTLFRIGASSLANELLSVIAEKKINYFD